MCIFHKDIFALSRRRAGDRGAPSFAFVQVAQIWK
nr:MAG TPA: hypothetical protein [Caudoviricetes sp.]